jgi:hypothetical protein
MKITSKNMHEKPTNTTIMIQFIDYVWQLLHVSALHFQSILSTAAQTEHLSEGTRNAP